MLKDAEWVIMVADIKRIALAYSGGLDTSVAIRWLAEKYGAKIITVTLDLGQGEDFKASRGQGAEGRCRESLHRGRKARVCNRVHLPIDQGKRHLPVQVPDLDGAGKAAHSREARGDRPQGGVRRGGARVHRQGATTRSGSRSPAWRATRRSRYSPLPATGG